MARPSRKCVNSGRNRKHQEHPAMGGVAVPVPLVPGYQDGAKDLKDPSDSSQAAKISFADSPVAARKVAVVNEPRALRAVSGDKGGTAEPGGTGDSPGAVGEEPFLPLPPALPEAEPCKPDEAGQVAATPECDDEPVVGPRPIELISYNNDSKQFEVSEAAMRVLARCEGPVGVVAVCGRARQGKSYILNQLLGQSTGGFQVASTHRPCTKGLWMWSDPVKMPSRDHHLVLLDTEGIDAYDQTGQYSAQIFSLAVLLSSVFVYNQLGGIDEAALDRLSLVTEMTKHIRARASRQDSVSAEWELGDFTPSLIWLLRDFYLMLESEDGRPVTPREYLETALQPVDSSGPSAEAKNQIRSSIKALFPDRDCFALVRPVHDEKELQRLGAVEQTELRPEFREGLKALTRSIFQRGSPKKVGGMTLTGPMLAGLTKAYVAAINDGAVPCILTAWQGVAEAECRRGSEAAEAEYARAFNYECSGEVEQLQAEHVRALNAASRVYERISVGNSAVRDSHDQRWRAAASSRFQDFKQRRLAEGAMACQEMLSSFQSRLDQMRRSGDGPEDLVQELGDFMDLYLSSTKASGPTKWPRFSSFVKAAFRDTVQDISEKTRSRQRELEEAIEEAAKAAEQSRCRLAAAEEEARRAHEEAVASRAQAEESRQEAEARRKSAEQAACRALMAQKKADASNSEAIKARTQAREAVASAELSEAQAEKFRREAEVLRGEVLEAREAEAESKEAAHMFSAQAQEAEAVADAAKADARRSRVEASKCRSEAREADARAAAAEEEMQTTLERVEREREEDKALKEAERAARTRLRQRRMVAAGVGGWVFLPLLRAVWSSLTRSPSRASASLESLDSGAPSSPDRRIASGKNKHW